MLCKYSEQLFYNLYLVFSLMVFISDGMYITEIPGKSSQHLPGIIHRMLNNQVLACQMRILHMCAWHEIGKTR